MNLIQPPCLSPYLQPSRCPLAGTGPGPQHITEETMPLSLLKLLAVTLLVASLLSSTIGVRVFEATIPNTVCTTNQSNWYTDVVGETPCQFFVPYI